MENSSTDRIEKKVLLKAPKARVWRAVADAEEFGKWFLIKFVGPFTAGKAIPGQVLYPGYEHLNAEFWIDKIEPESYFSYRWHPYAVDPKQDYSSEPMTLVEFRLEDAPGGTLLTITETGFDQIPIDRRASALRANDGGWAEQARNIERYVAQS